MPQVNFHCPIPWVSLSLGAQTVPRLCCHQRGGISAANLTDISGLSHLEDIRSQINQGEVPKQCRGCAELELAGCFSPRQDYLNRFGEAREVRIKYLDITFNNDCNLECVMCSPIYSHKLNKLYQQETLKWSVDLEQEKIEQLLPQLEMLTLTGGEPFVSKPILSLIKSVSATEYAKNITLRVFTNLTHFNESLMDYLRPFRKVELFLSIDSVKENYEFIRFPAKWERVEGNIQILKKRKLAHIEIFLHCVLMNVNWRFFSDLLDFYFKELVSFCAFPVTVEIESPRFLHPSVSSLEELESGAKKIREVLDRNELLFPEHSERISELRNLINKISKEIKSEQMIEYKVFLSKIVRQRKGGSHV